MEKARWLRRGWGPSPAENGRSTGTGPALSPQGALPVLIPPPRPPCRASSRALLPSSLFPSLWILAQTLHQGPTCSALCRVKPLACWGLSLHPLPPSDSRNPALCPQSWVLVQIPHWVTISSMNGRTSRHDPASWRQEPTLLNEAWDVDLPLDKGGKRLCEALQCLEGTSVSKLATPGSEQAWRQVQLSQRLPTLPLNPGAEHPSGETQMT